jgi:hypothetical protein
MLVPEMRILPPVWFTALLQQSCCSSVAALLQLCAFCRLFGVWVCVLWCALGVFRVACVRFFLVACVRLFVFWPPSDLAKSICL